MVKHVFITIASVFILACVPEQQIIDENPYIIKKGEAPWIIAHGGLKDLFPENTMTAFDGAVGIGVDALEMDVTLTKDNQLVTHHDLTIDRMSNGSGNVREFTYEELLDFNFGYDFQDINGVFPYRNQYVPIGLLEDVIKKYGTLYPLMIEIKDRGEDGKLAGEILYDLIEEYAIMQTVIVFSFDKEVMDHFYKISDGKIVIGSSQEETEDFVFSGLSGMEYLYYPKAAVVAIPLKAAGIPLDLKRIINSAHRRNMAVHYWTIDDPEVMKDLILKGVDGIMTDRADIMQEVLKEMGF